MTSTTSPQLQESVQALIRAALHEDRVDQDVTANSLVPANAWGRGAVVARKPGVVCGLFLLEARSPLLAPFPDVTVPEHLRDGSAVGGGTVIATLEGSARSLLALERTLLNFLQRLSGIATMTARFVDATRGTRAQIQETRKTCPGWRLLDKYAVACGGGTNHRMSLSDMVLIKENHLAFAGVVRSPAAIREALRRVRASVPAGFPVEVEVETLEQFDAALEERPDVIMLDDMSNEDVTEAVLRRDRRGPPPPLIEVSGGITLDRVRTLAERGVDRISVGALTHSVAALDIALDLHPSDPT